MMTYVKSWTRGSSPIIERFKVIDQIKKETEASCSYHIMPIIPYLTDQPGNLNGLYKMAKKDKR